MPESLRWRFRAVVQQLKVVSLTVVSASTDWWREVTGGSVHSDLPGDGDLLICTISSSPPGSTDKVLLSLHVSLLLTGAHPTQTLTHSRQTFHHVELQRCACPQNVPTALSATKKTFFQHQRSACLPHSAFTQSQSLFLILTLTSTNADNSWTEASFCTEENYTPSCDWEHVSSGVWKKKIKIWRPGAPRQEEEDMSTWTAHALMHSTLFLYCTKHARITIKLQLPFVHWNLEWKHCLSVTKFKFKKLHFYVLRLIVQVLVGVWYLTFNKASAFAQQDYPSMCELVFCARVDRMQRAILQHHLLVNEWNKKRWWKFAEL